MDDLKLKDCGDNNGPSLIFLFSISGRGMTFDGLTWNVDSMPQFLLVLLRDFMHPHFA